MANCLPSKQRIRVRFPLSALAIRIFCARRNSVLLDSCTLLASCALHQDALACDLYQLMQRTGQDMFAVLCYLLACFLRASLARKAFTCRRQEARNCFAPRNCYLRSTVRRVTHHVKLSHLIYNLNKDVVMGIIPYKHQAS